MTISSFIIFLSYVKNCVSVVIVSHDTYFVLGNKMYFARWLMGSANFMGVNACRI